MPTPPTNSERHYARADKAWAKHDEYLAKVDRAQPGPSHQQSGLGAGREGTATPSLFLFAIPRQSRSCSHPAGSTWTLGCYIL